MTNLESTIDETEHNSRKPELEGSLGHSSNSFWTQLNELDSIGLHLV